MAAQAEVSAKQAEVTTRAFQSALVFRFLRTLVIGYIGTDLCMT